ncbi:unnamed protein product [Rotaria sordida]|uniref:Chibby n=1 Tax=Rotaria sordida TaxID=392033 RepID=A0A813TF37_9BILA|nr:unnamed protein product [Rotaria sordida]CAF0863970.1 unnamed protein product [Rotaria sordida]
MSRSRLSIVKNNPFAITKTKPRKSISHSRLKFSSEELARELGPQYQTIDVRIGNQRMILNIAQGGWILDETTIESKDMTALEKQRCELEKDNTILRTKLDMLLEMLAEVTAEGELHNESDQ